MLYKSTILGSGYCLFMFIISFPDCLLYYLCATLKSSNDLRLN